MADEKKMSEEQRQRAENMPAPEGLKARTQPEGKQGKGGAKDRGKTDEIAEDVNEQDRRELEEAGKRNLGTPDAPDA
jgi:hypothetical protein